MAANYADERSLRIKHYKFLNAINKLKEQKTFAINDLKHQIEELEVKKTKLNARRKMLERRISQRETGLKFQIDHDFAWKHYYDERRKQNSALTHNAMPDEMESLKKMLAYDDQRSQYFIDSATENWNTLLRLQKQDENMDRDMQSQIEDIEMGIIKKKQALHHVSVKTDGEIENMQRRDARNIKELRKDA